MKEKVFGINIDVFKEVIEPSVLPFIFYGTDSTLIICSNESALKDTFYDYQYYYENDAYPDNELEKQYLHSDSAGFLYRGSRYIFETADSITQSERLSGHRFNKVVFEF